MGFTVKLIDAEFGPLPLVEIAREVQLLETDVVMIGHSGSSTAHPTVVELCRLLKLAMPKLTTVYGGVHPTYHWDEILRESAAIDIIVRGEGEETALRLMHTLASGAGLSSLAGPRARVAASQARSGADQLRRRTADWLAQGLEGISRSAHCRARATAARRFDARKRHRRDRDILHLRAGEAAENPEIPRSYSREAGVVDVAMTCHVPPLRDHTCRL